MPEISTPAQVVIVDYVCDTCREGHMIATGIALMSHPPKYPHACNKCGATDVFRERFPATRITKQEPKEDKMATNMKQAFLSAPADQIDKNVRDVIEKWDEQPTSLQVLEAIDKAIHGSNASGLAVKLMQQFYDQLLKEEGKKHEDNVPLAVWRTT